MGNMERDIPLERLADLYAELEHADEEHGDVSLTHESEWCLSAYSNGLLVWGNLEERWTPRHMRDVSREKVLALWTLLARGDLAAIEQEPWKPGNR